MMERELEQKKEETLGETLKTVFWAIVIAGMVRTFWVEPYKIPSGSMYPTLEVGDFLFISKYTYGYSKHSFPFSFPKFEGRIWDDKPQRGDVVVFKYPGDNKTDFIKRVVGLPGDKIQVKDGRLYINGEPNQRNELGSYVIREHVILPVEFKKYEEINPEGRKYEIIELADNIKGVDNTVEFNVPDGHYFMMGDNRDNSNDSRKDVGFVPYDNITGKARFLFYSHDGSQRWYNPISWFKAIRWKRIFNKII